MSRRRASLTKSDSAGSPPPGEPVFLAVGKLHRPHGVRGEIILEVLTDFPERLLRGATLFAGDEHQPLQLRTIRPNGATLLVSFDGYSSPETVGALRNKFLFVTAADRPPLPEGEYYHHQLIGLRVVTDTAAQLGVVREILETGANDVLVVRPPSGPEILLPAIGPVLLNVDLAKGEMLVHLLPGLIDELDTEQDADPAEAAGAEPAPGA